MQYLKKSKEAIEYEEVNADNDTNLEDLISNLISNPSESRKVKAETEEAEEMASNKTIV